MARPLVAIVGRPNVGKSTFFNQMAGRRIAIVEDTPGVTRDRVYADCEWQNHKFTLIDTGGIDPQSDDPLLAQMRRQAEIAVETCDVILFFVDGRQGLTADDENVADMLRKSGKPVMVVVNKIDNVRMMDEIYDFYQLGMGDPIGISSVNLLNFGDLLEELCKLFPDEDAEDEEDRPIQIAVVGKPNVGKSSLVNRILGEERVMVSDIAGTTRDAIDTRFSDGEESFVIIDTAGIRRKRAIEQQSLERYSVVRALAAIDRCDVALLLIDATQGVTEQDTKIAGYIDEQGKAAVICVNKWDAVEKETGTLEKYVQGRARTAQVHGLRPGAVHLRQDRPADAARAGQRALRLRRGHPPRDHGRFKRRHGRRAGGAAAPGHLGPQAEDLLRHAAGRAAAHVRALCQRYGADALFLRALSGKPVPQVVRL